MKVIIEIPNEFKDEFFRDRFSRALILCMEDIANYGILTGNKDWKILQMLNKAFNTCDVIIPNKIVKEFIETERDDEE